MWSTLKKNGDFKKLKKKVHIFWKYAQYGIQEDYVIIVIYNNDAKTISKSGMSELIKWIV